MIAQEIKNRIDSLNFKSKYFKNSSLNICDDLLKSKFISEKKKEEVRKKKLSLEKIKDPWLWKEKPNYGDLKSIADIVNEIYELL